MSQSIESSRPMLGTEPTRASTRFSNYSSAPTLTPSIAPSHISCDSTSGDPRAADIKSWNAGFERLDDKRLQQQRYIISTEKVDNMSKLALGAKLDRALGRRLSGQDAVFKPRLTANVTVTALREKDVIARA